MRGNKLRFARARVARPSPISVEKGLQNFGPPSRATVRKRQLTLRSKAMRGSITLAKVRLD